MNYNIKSKLYLFFIAFISSCIEQPDKNMNITSPKILYGIDETYINNLIIDSILREDLSSVTYCKIGYDCDTTTIIFFYEDDDHTPWEDEIIARSNRFLNVDTFNIPIIFESDYKFVIRDSIMNQKGFNKNYNWMNFAELKLFRNRKLLEYNNYYAEGGRKISEEGRNKNSN